MPTAITLLLPDQLYEQVKHLAQQQQQALDTFLIEEIARTISTKTAIEIDASPVSYDQSELEYKPDKVVEQERQAYLAMHEFLKENFFGKHVAIYQGQLIDFDDNFDALYERIDAKYPDVFVWLDTVTDEPMETISLRSPLFVEN